MAVIILTHLGNDSPFYIKDCIHQIRLWNMPTEATIYVILDPCHIGSEFWANLVSRYTVTLVFTHTLEATPHHLHFNAGFQGDLQFRKGYWKHVKERFFYVEELMLRDSLTHVISMEYDVLLYTNMNRVLEKLKTGHQTLRIVRDNEQRGHPAFIYIPSANDIQQFNKFLVAIIQSPLEDMQALSAYADNCKDSVHYLPVITTAKNYSIGERVSKCGHKSRDPFFLSEDSEHFGFLFDSLVVGQWVGGIDSRNMGGRKIGKYENESALYNINEMKFVWKKDPNTFMWQPFLDDRLLVMIHVHSKSLASFSSDRPDYPKDDYDVEAIYKTLLPN